MDDCSKAIQAALALRDALLAAGSWDEVGPALGKRGLSIDEVGRRLSPRIGFDPHNHTIHSDGIFSYRQLLWWCKVVGLQAIGITDHDNINPGIGEAIREGAELGVRIVPGLEFTVHRLGGQAWRGLEVGLHFLPADRFADFVVSPDGADFCKRFEETNRRKSDQAWAALELINTGFLTPRQLPIISRDELWEASGCMDPICVSTFTVLLLARFFEADRQDLLQEFPNTRVIHTYLGKHGFYPPIQSSAQTFDDIIEIRATLAAHGIRSTITLNHPEEWLSKCGLVMADGSPDLPGIRRLVALMLLHEPRRAPISFVELYSSRNTNESRRIFAGLFEEFGEIRRRLFPDLHEIHPIASTDSHRVSGFLDTHNNVCGWVPGEDFLFGLGMVDPEHPQGNLQVPEDYPGADELLERMDKAAM